MQNMSSKLGLGIIGCGDYLRWQEPGLRNAELVEVVSLFDTQSERAADYASRLGGSAAESADAVIANTAVDIVLLFVPPWVRRDLFVKAVAAGKHILTTKPLAPSVEDCAAMAEASDGAVRCGVMYGRTGDARVEAYKDLFESGEIGRLALYKQDWIHHYPQWNTWATDPEKNGGPFMDAMIHNLNTARYLMGRAATHATFFGESHAHELKCNDTESIKVDFDGNGSAHLFITWAADLAVQSTEGNYREHIDNKFMVTDQGWYIIERDGAIVASREGAERTFEVKGLGGCVFDRFAAAVTSGADLPRDIGSVAEAGADIKLIRDTEAAAGQRIALDLAMPKLSVVA
jgi:predicted dehydrogenase